MPGFQSLLDQVFGGQPSAAEPVAERDRPMPFGQDWNQEATRRHSDAKSAAEASASGAIMKRAAELQAELPDAPPTTIFQNLVRDPAFTKNILRVPTSQHSQLLTQLGSVLNPGNSVGVVSEGQTQVVRDRTGRVISTYSAPEKAMIVPEGATAIRPGRAGADTEVLHAGNTDDKETRKVVMKQLGDIAESGTSARHDELALQQLRTLGDRIGTGGAAAIRAHLARFGIKLPGTSDIEAYQALAEKLAPQQRIAGTGATSDKDLAGFKASLPALINSPGGNKLIIDTLQAMNDDKLARADIANSMLEGDLTAKQALQQMRKLPNPLARFQAAQEQSQGKKPEQHLRWRWDAQTNSLRPVQ